MKTYIKYLLSAVLIPLVADLSAQNLYNGSGLPVPNGGGNITMPIDFNTVTTLPVSKFNYVRTYVPLDTMRSIPAFNSTVNMRLHTATVYKGGLWNPVMTVTSAGINKDIVSVADSRPSNTIVSLLSYPVTYHSKFQLDAYTKQRTYYQTLYPLEGVTAYGKNVVTSNQGLLTSTSYSAGKAFVGYQRGTSERQSIAGATEVFKIEYSGGTLCKNGYYSANELRKTKVEGQNGAISITYVDKAKRLICKSVFAGGTSWLKTYYVYNEMGKLIYVIPPKAAEQLSSSNCISNINKLCYSYQYNAVGELVSKTTPGKADADVSVHDKYRRLMLVQTALMKANEKWQFNIYDQSNRVVVTGVYSGNVTAAYWNGILNGTTTPISYGCPTNQTLEYWLVNGLSNYSYPTTLCSCEIQGYNYYDRYDAGISGLPGFSDSLLNFCIAGSEIPKPYYLTHGKLLASKTKVLEANGNFPNTWITSVMYYDEKGRVIQIQTLNPWNTAKWDLSTTQYNFSGQPILSINTHHNPTVDKQYTRILTHNFYGYYSGRLDSVYQKIDSRIWQPIYTLRYDDLGRVQTKWLGNVEEQNYTYNIRGQLIGINANKVMDATIYPTMSYRSDIYYETGFDSVRYDGGIAGFRWKTGGSPTMYYGYTYDKANRMLGAEYRDYSVTGGTLQWNKTNQDFGVSNISYDENGNMLGMNQRGYDHTYKKADMDLLTYTYDEGNQLIRTDDDGVASPIHDFNDGHPGKDDDYKYDQDGNLITDKNKFIDEISYNILDLPYHVLADNGDQITNTYDASGALLRKEVNDTSGLRIWTYWGPFVYRNDSLKWINHEEGKARWLPDSNGYKYDYYVKDHLGNVRTVTTADVTDSTGAPRYRAGFELLSASAEEALFDNVGIVRDANPTGTPVNQMSARLNGSDATRRVAASILLHGMTGDEFRMNVGGYYEDTASSNLNTYATSSNMLNAIAGALTSNIVPGGEGTAAITTKINNLLTTTNYNIYEGLKATATDPAYPRSYLNILVFDESFNIKSSQSQVVQLRGGPFTWNSLARNFTLTQTGYLIAYLSHESNMNVYYDEVDLIHIAGRLLEEQHYYPHGLRIEAGIAASVKEPNKYLYQGKVMQEELGLELYDFHARQYDPQIGRFWGIDPADQFPSGYTGMGNDPANNIDPSGMMAMNNGGNISTKAMRVRGQIAADKEFWNGYSSGMRVEVFVGGSGETADPPEPERARIVLRDALDPTTQVFEQPGKPDEYMTKAAAESKDDGDFSNGTDETAASKGAEGMGSFGASGDQYEKEQKEKKEKAASEGTTKDLNQSGDALVKVIIFDSGDDSKQDLGHTAIQVNDKVYGFYPTSTNMHYSPGVMKSQSTDEFKQDHSGRQATVFELNVSSKQADLVQNNLNSIVIEPGTYSVEARQCTSVAIGVLHNSGVNVTYNKIPEYQQNVGGKNHVTPSMFRMYLESPMNINLIYQRYRIKY